jgi:hypothetical protein
MPQTDAASGPPAPSSAYAASAGAAAAVAARQVWATLRSIGVVRPGMRPDGTLGSWWAAGGPPLDVVAAVLRDAMGMDTDAPFHPLPEETVEQVAHRWLVESQGTAWYAALHSSPTDA